MPFIQYRPSLHTHLYPPCVFLHFWEGWHLKVHSKHSSTSEEIKKTQQQQLTITYKINLLVIGYCYEMCSKISRALIMFQAWLWVHWSFIMMVRYGNLFRISFTSRTSYYVFHTWARGIVRVEFEALDTWARVATDGVTALLVATMSSCCTLVNIYNEQIPLIWLSIILH